MTNPVEDQADEYRPPSVHDGTVSEALVRDLNRLVAEYGHAGVEGVLKELTSGGMLAYMGVDAQRWAEQFCAMNGGDEGLMIGWFANAIQAGVSAGCEIDQRRAVTMLSIDRDVLKVVMCDCLMAINAEAPEYPPIIPPTAIDWIGDRLVGAVLAKANGGEG